MQITDILPEIFFHLMPLKSLLGCPCLKCEHIVPFFEGGQHDPNTCMDFTKWIEDSTRVFPCLVCGKVLPTERGMKIHVTKMHKK